MTKLEVEAFLTIIKCGSISVAAEKLFVTQPALSRRIRALEQGPEDITIYGLTADSRRSGQAGRFLHAVHEEVTKVEGVQSFLE